MKTRVCVSYGILTTIFLCCVWMKRFWVLIYLDHDVRTDTLPVTHVGGNDGPELFWSWLSPVQTKHMSCLWGCKLIIRWKMRRVIQRHWHPQPCSCVSRCWCLVGVAAEPPTLFHRHNIQDIRKIMREHIFSNLCTKTELLIAPCWLSFASEGHIPCCI